MIVGISTKFDAAHYLPNYPGKCAEMHGHTWHVEVEVWGCVYDKTGMVVDLAQLKRAVLSVIEGLDHTNLNNFIKIPTCENVVTWIHDRLAAKYNITTIKVKEGDGGWART